MYHSLWQTKGVVYVPNVLKGIEGNPLLLSDSVHPNDRGYAIIAMRVAPVLKALYIPRPPPPEPLINIERNSTNQFLIAWQSVTNASYDVLHRGTIQPTNSWIVLTNLPGTGGVLSFQVLSGEEEGYYVLRMRP